MTDLTIFREYEPHELGKDGYPAAWHRIPGLMLVGPPYREALPVESKWGVKDLVRAEAGHRCERCLHPYVVGESGTIEEGDELHPARTLRETGFPQEALDAAFERRIADGEDVVEEPGAGSRTHWSPCDERCSHGGPLRCRALPSGEWRDERSFGQGTTAGQMVEHALAVEAAWRILTVHHLNGRKHDLRWWNLAALCQRCHLRIQTTVQMERVYPLEHTDWFKPHAAGWYAYAYEGLNLTREETMERLDELLALERAA